MTELDRLQAVKREVQHLAETTTDALREALTLIEMLRVEGGYDLRRAPHRIPTAREVYEPIFQRLDRIFASTR